MSSLNEKLPYDPFTDLAPISGLAQSPFILAAPLSFAGNSIADVIALAKAKPDTLSIGHGGNGTAMHLTAQLFNHMTGLDLTLVPYRGTGPVTQDVLAGHIPLGITDTPSALAQIQAKQIKALAISSRRRFAALPDVPTFDESGLPGYESIGWFGFVAPAGTAPEIIGRLNEAIVAALARSGRARSGPCARGRADARHAGGVRAVHPERIREVGEGGGGIGRASRNEGSFPIPCREIDIVSCDLKKKVCRIIVAWKCVVWKCFGFPYCGFRRGRSRRCAKTKQKRFPGACRSASPWFSAPYSGWRRRRRFSISVSTSPACGMF